MYISVSGGTASVQHHRYTSIRLAEAPVPDSHNREWINRLTHLRYGFMNRANCDTRTNGNDTHECRDATKREIIQHAVVCLPRVVANGIRSLRVNVALHIPRSRFHDSPWCSAARCEVPVCGGQWHQRWGLKSVRVFVLPEPHTPHARPLRDGLTSSQSPEKSPCLWDWFTPDPYTLRHLWPKTGLIVDPN